MTQEQKRQPRAGLPLPRPPPAAARFTHSFTGAEPLGHRRCVAHRTQNICSRPFMGLADGLRPPGPRKRVAGRNTVPRRGRWDLALALEAGSVDVHLPWAHVTVTCAAEMEFRVMGLPVSSSPRGVCMALTGSPHGGSWCAPLPVFTCLDHVRVQCTTVFLPGRPEGRP